MKQSFRRILFIQTVFTGVLLASAVLLSSCSSPFSAGNSHQYQIPWQSGDGEYKLQAVTIDSLSNPETLSSSVVRLFVTPNEDNGKLGGPPAVGRFATRKDGVKVPLDFVSMQGASINAHFERIRDFDRAAGVESLLSWPLQISVETDVSGKLDHTNNAFFDGRRNAILILPYNDSLKDGLPISLNGGVLAHEHFHALFYKLVLQHVMIAGAKIDGRVNELFVKENSAVAPLTSAKVGTTEPNPDSLKFNEFLLRATNEGLADFWSWLAIGDNDFVGRSIKELRECRRLDKNFSGMPQSGDLKVRVFDIQGDQEEVEKHQQWMAYQVGAQYARFLKELATSAYGDRPTFSQRVEMAQSIVKALGGFSEMVVSQVAVGDLPTDGIIDSVAKNISSSRLNEKSCSVIAEFRSSASAPIEGCAKFNLKQDDIEKKKTMRLSHAPPLEHCACDDEHTTCE